MAAPQTAHSHTERSGPSNVEFDGLFFNSACDVAGRQNRKSKLRTVAQFVESIMPSAKLDWSQIDRRLLRGVLADAAQAVTAAERTPSLMACLAENILNLAAYGEADPARLRSAALERMQQSCPACHGCAGFQVKRHTAFGSKRAA